MKLPSGVADSVSVGCAVTPSLPTWAGTAGPIRRQPLPCFAQACTVAVVFDDAAVVTVITCVAAPVEYGSGNFCVAGRDIGCVVGFSVTCGTGDVLVIVEDEITGAECVVDGATVAAGRDVEVDKDVDLDSLWWAALLHAAAQSATPTRTRPARTRPPCHVSTPIVMRGCLASASIA